MAGVLEHIKRSRRKLVKDCISSAKREQLVLELETAMEILAEVFGTNVSEIDELLKLRYQEGIRRHAPCARNRQTRPLLKHPHNEMDEWPAEFSLAERI